MKKASVIGIGRLGLCWALNLEKNGYDVLGVDIDKHYVQLLNDKTFQSREPFVDEYNKNAKNFLVSKLGEIQSIGHFLRTPTGYKVTAPEGFVAVDRGAGAVKLVDRLEFSRANFTAQKDWVKG